MNDKRKMSLRAYNPALHFGFIHERNAFLKRTRKKIASDNVVALAMTAEERHCESAVADAAVSSYIAHERNKLLRRCESDVAIP